MSWADGWIKGVAVVVGTFFIGVLGYFFLASVYAAFLGIFIDDALDAVRELHYPDAPWIKPPGMIESTISSLRFIAWSLFIYLLASPLLLVGYLYSSGRLGFAIFTGRLPTWPGIWTVD